MTSPASGPSRKRARQGDGDIIRSDLWLEDGNIILQAEQTQFRVHRSILSRHSTVFRDMFAMPQPDGEPLVEGCPVVEIHDKAGELEIILLILYDNLQSRLRGVPATMPASTLAAALKLGNKYELDSIRDEAISQLKASFPSRLEEWDLSSYVWKDKIWELVEFINLAYELSLNTMLPSALACLALFVSDQGELSNIFEGFDREDGTVVQLCPQAVKACILGRESLIHAVPNITLCQLDNQPASLPSPLCKRTKACSLSNMTNGLKVWHGELIWCGLDEWEDHFGEGLCEHCSKKLESIYDEGRETVWKELPSYFLLPTWDKLQDFMPIP